MGCLRLLIQIQLQDRKQIQKEMDNLWMQLKKPYLKVKYTYIEKSSYTFGTNFITWYFIHTVYDVNQELLQKSSNFMPVPLRSFTKRFFFL